MPTPAGCPDVLVIQCDSLPPDLVGTYGDPNGATPHIDALAGRGVRFDASCNAPLCTPSRASMMTGRLASRLDCFDNAGEFSAEHPTIAHAFGALGYRTAIVGKMHFIGHDQHHGFDERLALDTDYSKGHDPRLYALAYDWNTPSGGNPNSPQMMGESYLAAESAAVYRERFRRELHDERDDRIHDEALAYLSRQHDAPFLAVVSYHAPHNPFWAADELVARFDGAMPRLSPEIVPPAGVMDRWLDDFHYVPEVQDRLMQPGNLRWMYATVYAMLHELDRRVGALLAALPRPENTVVVFVSDHGDMLADRGMLQKRTLYERSVRVPLIVSGPGIARGTSPATPVSLVDLLPTLASFVGAPLPVDLDGVDLAPALAGGDAPRHPVVAEYHGEGVHAPCFLLRHGSLKYVLVHGHQEHLYDLGADPGERHDLAGAREHAETLTRLRAQLLAMVDPADVERRARASQRRRAFLHRAFVRRTAALAP
ncbi:sulfatase-like hydrolase/transferase [Microbacterium sp. HD4P20]|uniref:sulfatase-like hydrolase/transferase n=1 Tax=Microbacterium sp. HD4P20 TaxID=2864874 RepID=UPI001C63CCF4|nr:sulfatase-like hydrolase/transferase [Microbacterium sp. HD4P20]MCP2635540.1 sulfatase-like hydrolase/transferase [Microbacterium sp. HD4P20]